MITRRIPKFFYFVIFIFLAFIVLWTLLVSTSSLADSSTLSPNRCEILGLRNNCPAQVTLKITRRDGLILDDVRGASMSREVCMARAEEYYRWCGSKMPITARFFHNTKLVDQQAYPKINSTKCEIVGLVDNCPAQPTLRIQSNDNGVLIDDARNASRSYKVCLARAEEYYHWCGAKRSITARFLRGSKLVAQQEYPAPITKQN